MKALDAWMSFSPSFNSANSSGNRTNTVAFPIDGRREVNYRTRIELLKKSRWLRNNLGVYRRFISGIARYSVGCGISHIPATDDPDFNKAADTYFNDWADNPLRCDVRGLVSFWKMQKSMCQSFICDGDAVALKIGRGQNDALPQLQWLEATNFGNKLNFASNYGVDEEGFRDGVKQTPFGKPTAYRILQDSAPNTFDLLDSIIVPADAMIHAFDAERATSVRGLPWAYHGMNSAIDILDVVSLEKAAWRLHSTLAGSIKKKSGDGGRIGFGGGLTKTATTTPDGKPKVIAFDNFAAGAAILQLGLDEEFQLFSSNRPQTPFADMANFLIRDFAAGLGVDPEFFWSVAGLAGPNSRLVIENANWLFGEVQDLVVQTICRKVYTWVLARGLVRGELPVCKDPNWWRCHWQGPAKLTIDEGRLGQLELAQLDAGVLTREDFWAKRGGSGRKKMQERVLEIAEEMKFCTDNKVPYEFYRVLKPGANSGTNAGNNPDGTNSGQTSGN